MSIRLLLLALSSKIKEWFELDYMEYSSDANAQSAYVTNATNVVVYDNGTLSDDGTTSQSDRHIRMLLPADSLVNVAGTQIRFSFHSQSTATSTIDLCYMGLRSGTSWDMTAGNKVKVTFSSGSDSVTISAGATIWSDWITYSSDGTADLLLSCDFGAVTKIGYKSGLSCKAWDATNGATDDSAPAGGSTEIYHYLLVQVESNGKHLQSYSEATIKTQGSYSLKAVAAKTDSLNKTLTKTISPTINLTGINQARFMIRSSRTGSNIKIGLHDSGGTTTEVTPNIIEANKFQEAKMNLRNVSNADKDAIDQIIITIVNADAENIFYIDDMKYG